MNEYVYNSLSKEQKILYSEFLRDFIISEIDSQADVLRVDCDDIVIIHDEIFTIENKLSKFSNMVGLTENWEYYNNIVDHQHKTVNELISYKKAQASKPIVKKCNCSSFDMELSEVRALFEKSYTDKYLVNHDFVKIITDEGLKYKDPQLQDTWEGFLLFGIVLKSVKNPVTGEVMQ